MDDQYHLDLCLKWLYRAQQVTKDGGVSAIYEADKKIWRRSYPETTGYIIPTFLNYYKYFKNEDYKKIAIEMGDWEIDIISPDGGTGDFPGFYAPNTLKPRNFNTGQVMLGYLSLYEFTNNEKYLNAAKQSAEYVISSINSSGTWNFSQFNTPKSYNIRVAWPFLELAKALNSERYKFYGELMTKWVMAQANDNGWFKKNSFSEKDKSGLTHLIGYTLVGMLKVYKIKDLDLDYGYIINILVQAANNLCDFYLNKKTLLKNEKKYYGFPSYFDKNWKPLSDWSCVTGNTQIEFFMRDLGYIVGKKQFIDVANLINQEIKNIHILDDIADDPNLIGGLFGSSPIEGDYCPYQIPNWGVKFFSDSLMQKIYINDKIMYVG